MMQSLQHQQQQLAALVSAALPPQDNSTTSSSTTQQPQSSENNNQQQDIDSCSSRIGAITSLHRAILFPPNSLLVHHSSSFLFQAFSKLLSDKSNVVRQAAATAYGAFCAVLCSVPLTSNGRQNHALLTNLVDRFIGWALPLLRVGDGPSELALESLREFLSVGDIGAIERYALPVLKACQELLEDERTSLSLLHRLLGVLTLISLKFFRCFQPHFVDIVDLLLGWAMVPDLADTDRRIIMDSFLQFQKHWVNNLPFSLGLLSKFLGDMDVMLQDASPGTPQQRQRLLVLLSCFSTVLQSTASGLLEINLLEQIWEPLAKMLPPLLAGLSMVGKKFGWSKWIAESWRCLTLLAEILGEKFSSFYSSAVDILFQCLEMDISNQRFGVAKINSVQVHGVLRTNLQLLSLQKHGLLPSSACKILQFYGPISQLRLHPNHLVTGSSAAAYIFLLQHRNNEVVEHAVNSLCEELELLKSMLLSTSANADDLGSPLALKSYSRSELFAFLKFDLKVLLSCVSLGGDSNLISQPEILNFHISRSDKLIQFIIKKLNPFEVPVKDYVELQATVVSILGRLTAIEFSNKCSTKRQKDFPGPGLEIEKVIPVNNSRDELLIIIFEYLEKYTIILVNALQISSPLAVKLEAIQWIEKFCESVSSEYGKSRGTIYPCQAYECTNVVSNLVISLLDAASDKEPKVRIHVSAVLEVLLQARLIPSTHFYVITEAVLERLGDADKDVRNVFMRLLSDMLPMTLFACGMRDDGIDSACTFGTHNLLNRSNLHWKQIFALKQLPQQLHSQQLVSILSYISQRWKVPLSSWIQRLVCTCRHSNDLGLTLPEETGNVSINALWWDKEVEGNILERVCSVNIIAGAWWAIHEAARYCITTRLRTNLGGPTQTFAALERMLLDVALVLQLDSEQSDGNLNLVGSSYAHLLPLRLLLEFVEALKKNVYNAYDGSIVLACASRQSSLFFRANKKVCEEWFSRICEPMMNAGLALQCHDATIHYSTLRLQELSNQVATSSMEKNFHNIKDRFFGDVLRVLRHMALALCKMHDSEALTGLQKWACMSFFPLFSEDNRSLGDHGTAGPLSWITGLIYQAKGQYEKAAAHFTHLLQIEDSLSTMGSDGVHFAIARIIDSYTAVSDWKSLNSWLSELHKLRAKHAGKSYSGALTMAGIEMNAVHALAHFDEGDFQASWAYLDLTPKSSSELTLDPKLALQRSEQMLLQAMLLHIEGKSDKVSAEIHKAKSILEETLSILPLDGLSEAAAHLSHLHCIFALEENCKLSGDPDKQLQSLLSSYIQAMQSPINQAHQDCKSWLKILRVYKSILPAAPVSLKLCKNLLSLARKQSNLMLANRLHTYLRHQILDCPKGSSLDFMNSSIEYEGILLTHAEKKFEDALINLWTLLKPCLISPANTVAGGNDNFMLANACLKLSDWVRQEYSDTIMENFVLQVFAELNVNANSSFRGSPNCNDDNLSSKPSINIVIEELVGTFTKLSTCLCPTMGKSWIYYASWCFSQAKADLFGPRETVLEFCSFSPNLVSEIVPDKFKLTQEELTRVVDIVSQYLLEINNPKYSEKVQEICKLNPESSEHARDVLVQQVINIIEAAAGAPGAENVSGGCLSATLASQLQKCLQCDIVGTEGTKYISIVSDLVDVWWSLRSRRVSLFGHAAQAYVNHLRYSFLRDSDSQLPGSGTDIRQKSASHSLRATLYILHILLNYGVELKDTLEHALLTVPLLPWQEITPQLFARLSSHPEPVVRKQLEGMLVMLAKLSPWSVVYPSLVDVNSYEEEPSEELQHVLACLSKLYPRLIQDVQLVIKELENVTVLWEELWLSTLQDLHTDVIRRINLLKEEAARIADNTTLTHAEKNKINATKYAAMMAPIFVALERRLASTSRKPETPHEMWFHQEYKEQIKMAILNFKIPPATASALGDVWRPFDSIAASLASYQRKSSVTLGDVAPQLAQLSSSDVPMPGLEKQITMSDSERELTTAIQGIVTIASFTEHVTILPTKTRPKKLVILGSDGQTYPYLLKGREDLRLDARIMQLLQAINGFLHSSSAGCDRVSRIRYYSVTPISGRAGLIQWVDNVTSIYSVFKSWQSRVQLAQLSTLAGNPKNSVPPPVPRPSDMFYGKIIPALKEKGIRRVISRRDWPHEVKRKVFLDLTKESPRQLLHQELWCASEGFKAFSSKLKRYSVSLAAMSMIGHILGLGDRHLDNILMDFSSGDVVHIDYNVCFDKGHRLKIAEIVPFRLTQTLEAALGLTGVEGTFRANCEAVLSVLKNNKDILLMLLEVFVWDPLVEWTRGDFHDDAAIVGEERKGMELAVSLSLFASRVQEIRVPLQEHHDLLVASFPAIESALMRFTNILNEYEIISTLFSRADKERSNLVHKETSAKSVVAEATTDLEKSRATYEMQTREFAQAKALVVEKAEEAASWIEQHGKIIDAIRSSSIPEIKGSMNLAGKEESLSLTSAVIVAGVPLTIVPEPTQVQCHEIDREVSQLMSEFDNGFSSAVTSLQTYSLALQRLLPLNYLSTSPVHNWAQVLHVLANTAISSDILSLSRRQAAEFKAKVRAEGYDSVECCYDDLCHKVEKYGEGIQKLEEERLGLVNSIGSETESKAKDHLLSTFVSYMQSADFENVDSLPSTSFGLSKHERTLESRLEGKIEEKKKIITVLNIAVSSLYNEVKHRVLDILNHTADGSQDGTVTIFSEFAEQVEKCVLLTGFVDEVHQYIIKSNLPIPNTNLDTLNYSFHRNWASLFSASLISCKGLVGKMLDMVPDAIRAVISYSSEVMDSFGSLSQIRGSIDTALEDLIQVEIERASLNELVQNYFLKVGHITEKQLVLEEASLKGRDHLSWEEAEELASQEEACRAQLDKLHHSWNQKDLRNSSLLKREASIKSVLFSAEHHFESLLSNEQDRESQISKVKNLLLALMQPFIDLELVDKSLSSFDGPVSSRPSDIFGLRNLANSGCPMSECIWKFSGILSNHSFFIWKVAVIDSFLNSCIHDAASSADYNLGFDQLVTIVRKKLESQLQGHLNQYLTQRVSPALLTMIDTESELLKQIAVSTKDISFDDMKKEFGAVNRVKLMLEEYCNAHETVRAARSAASVMNKQVNELRESLLKTTLDIVQMEWINDVTFNPLCNYRLISHKFLAGEDNLFPVILNLSRPKLLESIQSSVGKLVRSLEGLQACEQNSATAERQLERAMGWACGGSNSTSSGNTSVRNSGIPSEFHDHLIRRGQMLLTAQEKGSEMIKVCMSVLEFEASRDGIFQNSGEIYSFQSGADARIWQQIYLYTLTRLDVTYHSFICAEQELQLAQSNMETASSNSSSASSELSITSAKAKLAADDLQSTLVAMKDCAYEASLVLSAYARVTRGHTALTSECGSMLEEVLAITEGLHDVYSLGKEAAVLHISLMEDLTKANAILLPLESVLSKDVTAMTDAMTRERETKMEISPIHGQAIHQSYYSRIKEACQAYKPLVPSLTSSVKGLHSMLTRLARAASLHAGNLHKALEGLGESQEIRSQDVNLSRPDVEENDPDFDNKDVNIVSEPDREYDEDFVDMKRLSVQDKGWISPPDSIYSSSLEFDELSAEANEKNVGDSETMQSESLVKSSGKESLKEQQLETRASPSYSLGSEETEVKVVERPLLNQDKVEGDIKQAPLSNMDVNRITRGKNAYALSVLRRVEMKLEGQDIANNREISIADQVDHLIKQATSVDNLCNMYEGWTPWI
ncbi:Non-specific serine/threonine protein kinase [Heracleum sosnowskyi]|uniref:non-specific serine/threonine protein kinase n=1 Tax=Heracleum sosnowskyi TaxID=360622 RepID=A0AAD8ME59_9APIA|nr:Non-specific serine/threonine protein kinase [Heracleum sosnowskyi]